MFKHISFILMGILITGAAVLSDTTADAAMANKQGGAKTRLPNSLPKHPKGEQPAEPESRNA